MTQRSRQVRRRLEPSGLVLSVGVVVLCAVSVFVLAVSPTLNPLGVLLGQGFSTRVPDVRGETQTRALLDLESAHLDPSVRFEFSSSVARGLVVRHRPGRGERVLRGTDVVVWVSRGPARLVLPDFTGMPERRAASIVREAGIDVELSRVNDETAPEGEVFEQRPGAGVTVVGGQSIQLTVSLGPAARTVPDLSQLPLEGALFVLGRAGLSLSGVVRVDNAEIPAGVVVGVDPAPGTTLSRDGEVRVTVSNGAPPVAVPRVVGLNVNEAVPQLAALGFMVGEVPVFNNPPTTTVDGAPGAAAAAVAPGTVLAQVPAPGTMLRPGQVVTLSVRRTLPAVVTTVPAPPPQSGTGG